MFREWQRRSKIRRVLKRLARQNVVALSPDGKIWVIENALVRNAETEAILRTCLMRGWVEIFEHNVPIGDLTTDMKLPDGPMFTRTQHAYQLTDSGWAKLNRMHLINVATLAITLVGLVLATGKFWQ